MGVEPRRTLRLAGTARSDPRRTPCRTPGSGYRTALAALRHRDVFGPQGPPDGLDVITDDGPHAETTPDITVLDSCDGAVSAVHDISDGGLLLALAEMAIASGIGAVLDASSKLAPHAFWFGEDQARYVVTARDADGIARRAAAAGVPLLRLGATGGRVLAVAEQRPLPVDELKHRFESWLPAYMAGAS